MPEIWDEQKPANPAADQCRHQLPAAWVITMRYPGEEDEVAAVFADHGDAQCYAVWWNREEVRRHGQRSSVVARAEEIDFYPVGAWRPPARPRAVASPPSGPSLDGSGALRGGRGGGG